MKNKNYIILALLILAELFYWFQIRPTRIRKNCSFGATTKARENLKIEADKPGGWGDLEKSALRGQYRQTDYLIYFSGCLNENGLK